jgi:gliding motility-associated-like protein
MFYMLPISTKKHPLFLSICTARGLFSKFTLNCLLLLLFCFSKAIYGQNTNLNILQASDAAFMDWYGRAITLSENHLVVGAPRDDNGGYTGAIYIYEKDNTGIWGNEQKLFSPDNGGNDFFGMSVSISGNMIVAGAMHNSEQTQSSGGAYIFEMDALGNWNLQQKLTAFDAGQYHIFGSTVFASQDYIAVTAGGNAINTHSGSVYMFEKDNNGSWYNTQKITIPSSAVESSFGVSLSIYGDYLAVGNPLGSELSDEEGSVFIYKRAANGTWENTQIITASDGGANENFGQSVSLSENHLVVGAPNTNDFGLKSGAVYIYELADTGLLINEQKIFSSEQQSFSYFGHAVDIFENQLIVGAIGTKYNFLEEGSAYIFNKNSNGNWILEDAYAAFDAASNHRFGNSVALSADDFAIGARDHSENGASSGAVYVKAIDCAFTLECPESKLIETTAGTCEGLLEFEDAILVPQIIDGCGTITISQTSGPTNIESVGIGIYEIEFEAISTEGISATCNFTIEIEDKEAPIASCKDLELNLDPCGEVIITASDIDLESSDACGIANLELSQSVFDDSSIGLNLVELTVTDINGNTSTCTSNILISPFSNMDESGLITSENISIVYGESIELTPNIEAIDGFLFSWYVDGDLYCSDCYSLNIFPESNISIELLVQHEEGCLTLRDAFEVQLQVDYSIYIPTVFSPNNDGINDYFEAYFSPGVQPVYELQIRDRWGNIVFHKKGEQIAWNGSFRGQEAMPGVYTYVMICSLVTGTEIVKTGDVCLIP